MLLREHESLSVHIILSTMPSSALFEMITDGVFEMRTATRISFINGVGARMLGRTKDEVMGNISKEFLCCEWHNF